MSVSFAEDDAGAACQDGIGVEDRGAAATTPSRCHYCPVGCPQVVGASCRSTRRERRAANARHEGEADG